MQRLRSLLLLALLTVSTVTALAAPYRIEDIPNVQVANRSHYVSNPDGILSAESVERINFICDTLRTGGYAELAVVAVKEIASDDVFTFAHELFSTWGVGRAEGDNGLGILLVDSAHEIRFVTGHGMEGILPDAICKRIQMNYMLPHFRRNDYSSGMLAGVVAVARILEGSEPLAAEGTAEDPTWLLILFFVCPFVALMLIAVMRSRCPKCGKRKLQLAEQYDLGYSNGFRLYQDVYTCRACGAKIRKMRREIDENRHRGGMGGGPFIGGFGGGSFGGGSMGGGFGGGSFGGGGAGSRW